MDPVLWPAILSVLAPVLATLGLGSVPIGIIWIIKNHQFRMKELEIEGQRYSAPSAQQLAAIEARLSAIEAALAGARDPLQARAALLEGPATSASAEVPQPAQLRQR